MARIIVDFLTMNKAFLYRNSSLATVARRISDDVTLRISKYLRKPSEERIRGLLELTDNYTMVDRTRRVNILRLIGNLERRKIRGNFVECGVFKGGIAALLAEAAHRSALSRSVWLSDSFERFPGPTARDGRLILELYGSNLVDTASIDYVNELVFKRLHLSESKISIVKGLYRQTLDGYDGEQIAFLHIDADWCDSVKTRLDKLYKYVAPGGVVVLDDYGFCIGCRRALKDFLKEHPLKIALRRCGWTQAFFSKPG